MCVPVLQLLCIAELFGKEDNHSSEKPGGQKEEESICYKTEVLGGVGLVDVVSCVLDLWSSR